MIALPICQICGAVVGDVTIHESWHAQAILASMGAAPRHQLLGPRGTHAAEAPPLAEILAAAAAVLRVELEELIGSSRTSPLMHKRHVTMWACRKFGYSYPQIATAFRRRHHDLVINACRRVDADDELVELAERVVSAARS